MKGTLDPVCRAAVFYFIFCAVTAHSTLDMSHSTVTVPQQVHT
jgi:hypothetical protein